MGSKSLKKAMEQLVGEAEEQGFKVKDTKKGWLIMTPNGQGSVALHKTPSDHHAPKNALARLRRYGFKVDGG